MKGLIHVYTGDGKGKTTASAGIALRAAGQGMKVFFVQFQKAEDSGEIKMLRNMNNVEVWCICTFKKFFYYLNDSEKKSYIEEHAKAWEKLTETIKAEPSKYDVLILDEALGAVSIGALDEHEILDFLKNKPEHLEVILNGRNASHDMMEAADYVSDIRSIKHPFDQGLSARKGIEY
ncbi:MAG: cob(I)yrinic acid a,c-diamide adenosyltransferase [Clostridia bacterium]|jgi:cob(I)alamin adenosyltransferase